MSNEAQYFSPIVSAMMDVVKAGQQKQAFQQQKEQFAQNQELEKQKLAQSQQLQDTHARQIEYEHEHNQSMIEHLHDVLQSQNKKEQADRVLQMQKAVEGGASPEIANLFPGMKFDQGALPLPQGTPLPPGTQPGPGPTISAEGAGSIPAGSLYNPQAGIDRLKQMAAAQAGGTVEGQLPGLIAEEDRKRETERLKSNLDWQHKLSELTLTGANQEKIANIHNAGMMAEANINNAGRLKGIMLMRQFGLDDGSGTSSNYAKQLTDDIFDGNKDYSKLNKDQQRLVDNWAAATGERGLPAQGKDYNEKLGTITGLQALVNQYRDLANNYSKDAPGGGFLAMHSSGQLGILPTSDLNSKLDTAKASGGALASFFDKQNRKSDAEILRQTKGFFDPTATRAENLQKIDTQTKLLQQGVRNVFTGMNPDRVNLILKDHGVTDFGGFSQQTPNQSQTPSDVVTDSKGNNWKYKGTGDRNVQSNYDPVPKGGQ